MKLLTFTARVKNLLLKPFAELKIIWPAHITITKVFFLYVLPFILSGFLATITGRLIFTQVSANAGVDVVIKSSLYIFLAQVITLFFVTYIVNEIIVFFKGYDNYVLTFKMISYSLTPYYISFILAGLLPAFAKFIWLFGFYSVIIFWHATGIMTNTDNKRKLLLLIIVSLLFVFSYIIIIGIINGLTKGF